jgi:hypothetical protein
METLDLNQPPVNIDLVPVIINPVEHDPQGFGEQTRYLLQEHGEVFHMNSAPLPEPNNTDLAIAIEAPQAQQLGLNQQFNLNELPGEQTHNSHTQQISPENFLVEEFSPNQLMSTDDSSSEKNTSNAPGPGID